jgi:hypothetical protein
MEKKEKKKENKIKKRARENSIKYYNIEINLYLYICSIYMYIVQDYISSREVLSFIYTHKSNGERVQFSLTESIRREREREMNY